MAEKEIVTIDGRECFVVATVRVCYANDDSKTAVSELRMDPYLHEDMKGKDPAVQADTLLTIAHGLIKTARELESRANHLALKGLMKMLMSDDAPDESAPSAGEIEDALKAIERATKGGA